MEGVRISLQKKLDGAKGALELEVSLKLPRASFSILAGPSGAGKTSILRMVSGLMKPDKGKVLVDGQSWYNSRKGIFVRPEHRLQGFVFQDYALFPNMSVKENLLFARNPRESKSLSTELMEELLSMMDLAQLRDRKAVSLSGGQQQRVALARALMRRPPLLLLDEPFAALDPQMRRKMQDYILLLHRHFRLTTLMVSHDQAESINLADQIYLIDDGKVVRSGSPEEVFTQSKISGKFRFIGEILSIQKADVVSVVSVLIGREQVKVIADEAEVEGLGPGDKVMVVSKAFNPILKRLDA